jgi:hypothetical protein
MVLLVTALLESGCARSPHPGQATVANPAPGPAAPASGAPLIADSDDLVHIEYHVYGRGSPAVVLIHGWLCNSS